MSDTLFAPNKQNSLNIKDIAELPNIVGQKIGSYPSYTTVRVGPQFEAKVMWVGWEFKVYASSENRALHALKEILAHQILSTETAFLVWNEHHRKYIGSLYPFKFYERLKEPLKGSYDLAYTLHKPHVPATDTTDTAQPPLTYALFTEMMDGILSFFYKI